MIWIIASVPFWILGFFFCQIASIAVFARAKPNETPYELMGQFLASLVVGGIFLVVAAGIASIE